jgi:dipeptidyl aminopeptidase/acylaminoacyl peptidase
MALNPIRILKGPPVKKFIQRLCLLVLGAALAGCAIPATHPALSATQALPALIPVRDFVANRGSNFAYQVSPDDRKLAWIAVKGVHLHLFVKELETGAVRTFRADRWYGFQWGQDSRNLLAVFQTANENSYLVALDSEAADAAAAIRVITPPSGLKIRTLRTIIGDPDHLLISHNRRQQALFDLYRLDLRTGEQTLTAQNPGAVAQWLTNSHGELVGRIVKQADSKTLELCRTAAPVWRPVYRWSDEDRVSFLSLSEDGARIYLLSDKGRDRLALVELDPLSGEETIRYEDPVADVTGVYLHPVTGQPLVAFSCPDYPRAVALDDSLAAAAALFARSPAGFSIDSADNRLQHLTLSLGSDKGYEFYLFDSASRKLELLGNTPLLARKNELADIRPVEIISRDHVLLHAYLTLPKGVPPQGLPLVLLVHGGPWARDYWRADSEVQFLANRGYAVLQVNYRGSSGYGRHFQELAVGEFAGKMQDDLLDGVNWAIAQGIADPAKIAIVGGSYGGYAALVGLSFTPEVFACGIDINGMADLAQLIENFPPYWKLELDLWYRYVGNPQNETDRAVMRTKSPLYKTDAIVRPLLVIQGEEDVRVQKEQSLALVARLRQDHKPVSLWLVPGTGHMLANWPLRLKQFRKTEDFLARCLGGRSSGFDFYQLGAWLF